MEAREGAEQKNQNIQEWKRLQGQKGSDQDSFTGLMNKVAAIAYSRRLLELTQTPVYFCMIDLDYFKEFNDCYGHSFGDQVLLQTTKILLEVTGEQGVVARFGGDEFFLILDRIPDNESLRDFLRTLRSRLAEHFAALPEKLVVTCSIGISAYPKNSRSFDELFEKSDKALYIAKNKGRNRYIIYTEEIHDCLRVRGREEVRYYPRFSEQLVQNMSGFCVDLIREGRSALPAVLEQIRKLYDVEYAGFFQGEHLEKQYSCGRWPDGLETLEFLRNEKVAHFFNENGYHRVNLSRINTEYLEDFHGILESYDMQDNMIYLIGTPNAIQGVVILGDITKKISRLASSDEIHLLEMLVRIIGEVAMK